MFLTRVLDIVRRVFALIASIYRKLTFIEIFFAQSYRPRNVQETASANISGHMVRDAVFAYGMQLQLPKQNVLFTIVLQSWVSPKIT